MKPGEGLWMSPGAKVSVVVLFLLALAVGVTAYLAAVGYYHREQAAQQHQSQAFERRLCTSLGRLAALQPPPGSPADLSRAYLRAQHQVLAELGPDVGCGR